MNYNKIKVPIFYLTIDGVMTSISEYDVRNIQYLVSIGKMKQDKFIIQDIKGVIAIIRDDGFMNNELEGMTLNGDLSLKLLDNK